MTVAIIIMTLATNGILYLVIRDQQKTIDRQNEMIMAKDYGEYKDKNTTPPVYDPVDVSDEEAYWREIEANKQ